MAHWGFENIPVPINGSCVFTSISMAINDSMGKWMTNPNIREIMEHH